MKLGPTFAMGLALAFGAVSLASGPAFAADDGAKPKKEKKAKAPKPAKTPPISPKFSAFYNSAFSTIEKKDYAGATALLDGGRGVAASPYENYLVEQLYYKMAAQQENRPEVLKRAISSLATGGTPESDVSRLNWLAGNLAYDANDYATAVKYLTEADRLNYPDKNYLISLANASFKTNNFAAGAVAVEKAIADSAAKGQKAPEAWYRVTAREAGKAGQPAEAAKWTARYIKDYNNTIAWNYGLATFRDSNRLNPAIQIDLFRLMRDTGSLTGLQDWLDYAALAQESALPGEASAVIDEAFAKMPESKTAKSTSGTLIFVDRKREADAMIAADKAGLATSEKIATNNKDGKVAANTGNTYLAYGNYEKAVQFYDMALSKGGATVDVNAVQVRRGIALSRLGRKDEARTAFNATQGAYRELASFWQLYLDTRP